MIEKIGNKEVVIRDYTSNYKVKEFIQNVLIPKAYPDIEVNDLNLGLTGITSEMISQAIEDAYGTASLMMNEAFITRATLPNSIYSEASLFNLGYTFATPSRCKFALQIWLPDVIKYSTQVKNSNTFRYRLDKNTKVIVSDNSYKLDYDIIIDHVMIGGKRVFNVYYDMDETNSISIVTNRYINHQTTSIDWLILFLELQEFDRKTDAKPITDNLVTTNSDINIKWTRQIAGFDLTYITPSGDRISMKKQVQYTKAGIEPFAWYRFVNDNCISLSFSNNKGFFSPAFNSKVEYTIYTCKGKSADFPTYDPKAGVPVQKTGERFSYNANTRIVALCYGGSTGGMDKGDIELLRDDVILAHNTANVLTSEHDLQLWFNRYGKRYNTRAEFFKRRDDPSGTLYSQFVAITNNTYVYPTNTLSISVDQDQFDFINNNAAGVNQEFIIKPGHLWEYDDKDDEITKDNVRMVMGANGPAMVFDDALPPLNENRQFMFVNPFYIKIYRYPTISSNYNCMINNTSWLVDVPINNESFYQFQLVTFHIERSLSKKYHNKYHIQLICVPVVDSDRNMKYVEGIGKEYPKESNNLRVVLITKSSTDGETGYIEMDPIELRKGGAILYETEISVYDNVSSDMTIEIDLDNTPEMHPLLQTGPHAGRVLIDASETSFYFACMMKDFTGALTTNLFGDSSYKGYVMTNKFMNDSHDLTLFKPMTMMRSTITFEGENNNYHINCSWIPFIKYDIPLDDEKMNYFIMAYDEQYRAMEPIASTMSKMNGNSSIDFKLFNTYGRSRNYYIGPMDGDDVLQHSTILLNNVYIKIRFRLAVWDRSMYLLTVESIMNEIQEFVNSLNNGDRTDLHSSDLIYTIKNNIPNVKYIRFLGFNDYDATKGSIFVKYTDKSSLSKDNMKMYVPEMIRIDSDSIEITEEV